MSVFVDRLLKD